MRKIITASIAFAGMLALAPLGASAAPLAGPVAPGATADAAIQPVDWGCGPRCRHERWEHARREHWRREHWRREHYGWRHAYPYRSWYGYNYGYRY